MAVTARRAGVTLRSVGDLDRLSPAEYARLEAWYRQQLPAPAARPAWDAKSREVAALSREDFARLLARSTKPADLLRQRWRWRVDEFAEAVIRPIMEPLSGWARDNDVIRSIYAWPGEHWRARREEAHAQLITWAPRGAAKTTAVRVRALHAGLASLEAGLVVIASTAPVAADWVGVIAGWVDRLSAQAREVYPDVTMTGRGTLRLMRSPTGTIAYHARGWLSGDIRGINHDGVRPTAVIMDDIESYGTTSSKEVCDASQGKLLDQVMPVFPLGFGGNVWWPATPVAADCLSARAYRGEAGMEGWALERYRAVVAWPVRSDLWERCREVFRDVDGAVAELEAEGVTPAKPLVQKRQARRARAFYHANRAAMDEGAVVLDPERLPIIACYMILWSIGVEAFEREYQTNATPKRVGSIFDPSAWVQMIVSNGSVHTPGGRVHPLSALWARAHWDPSDGGDPGAIAVGVALPDGRAVLLYVEEYPGRMSEQIPAVVSVCDRFDADLQAEANMMHDSEQVALRTEVMRINAIRVAANKAPIGLVFQQTTENKERRIRSLDTPLSGGTLAVTVGIDGVLARRAGAWDPAKTCVDDVLDAVQRVGEMCGVIGDTTSLWGDIAAGLR